MQKRAINMSHSVISNTLFQQIQARFCTWGHTRWNNWWNHIDRSAIKIGKKPKVNKNKDRADRGHESLLTTRPNWRNWGKNTRQVWQLTWAVGKEKVDYYGMSSWLLLYRGQRLLPMKWRARRVPPREAWKPRKREAKQAAVMLSECRVGWWMYVALKLRGS